MTFAFSYDVPGNPHMYAAVKAEIGPEAPRGLVAQLVLQIEQGLRHVMAWDEPASWEDFHITRVVPAVRRVLASSGIPAPPAAPEITHLDLVDVWIPADGRRVHQTSDSGVSATAAIAAAYAQAWIDRGPSAIAEMHTHDSVFHLHDILEPYEGRDAIAAAAAAFFADSPDLQFEPTRVHLGVDHFVSEYLMHGTLAGRRFACEGTDVVTVRDGQIARKDSYIDWLTYVNQTGIDPTARGARLLPAT